MPHIFGDHNRPIVEFYLAELGTEDGAVILECWSMEPTDAAMAFHDFFTLRHPGYSKLTDLALLKEHPPQSEAWFSTWNWWRSKPAWTGDYIELSIECQRRSENVPERRSKTGPCTRDRTSQPGVDLRSNLWQPNGLQAKGYERNRLTAKPRTLMKWLPP